MTTRKPIPQFSGAQKRKLYGYAQKPKRPPWRVKFLPSYGEWCLVHKRSVIATFGDAPHGAVRIAGELNG